MVTNERIKNTLAAKIVSANNANAIVRQGRPNMIVRRRPASLSSTFIGFELLCCLNVTMDNRSPNVRKISKPANSVRALQDA
jgi:hypothetical protein